MDDLQVFAALRPVEPPLSNHERSAMRTQLFTTSSADAADVDHGLAEVLPFGDHRRPPAVIPTSSTGERRPRWLGIAAAAVAAVGLGGLWVGVANRDLQEPAAGLPAGFNEGLYGTQIVLTEVPDGDADTETFVLRTEPDVGTVTGTKHVGVVPTTAMGSAAADSAAPSPPVLCIETTGGGSACMPQELLGPPSFLLDARRANGQVVVYALPSSAVAVTFAAGTERYWSEPLHGVVSFPFLESAAPNVTFAAVDRDGRVVWRDTAVDSTLTRAEVAAATITEQTDDVLADGWFGDVGQNGYGPELIRLHGRTTLTGFQGPFALQEHAFGTGGSIRTWVSAITVSAVDVVAVQARLEPLANGSVRTVLEPNEDTRVLIWAGDYVPDGEVSRYAATLQSRAPLPDRLFDLDIARAWSSGEHNPRLGMAGGPLLAIVGDVIGQVDRRNLVAHADDIGEVMFTVEGFNGSVAFAGRPTSGVRVPTVGDTMGSGLWPVPADLVTITLTYEDGTTVTPEVIDVRPIVDAKLVFFPAATTSPIAKVDITR